MNNFSHATSQYTRFCIGLALLGLLCSSAWAADGDAPPQSLSPGMRVRILAPDLFAGQVIGIVDQVSNDSVTLRVPGRSEPLSILREKIGRLDVSDGRRSRGFNAALGAVIGAGLGAGAGALAGGRGRGHIVSEGTVAAICAVFGAGVGGLTGALLPPGERWTEISAPRYRVSFAPRLDHGLDMAVAWRF